MADSEREDLSNYRRGRVPEVGPDSWWRKMWRPFWVLPTTICVVAVLIGLIVPEIERLIEFDVPQVFRGGTDGARSVLGTIASAMISVTGLVFSITIVVLQLAASQYSPRVLGSFLSSRITQTTLGIFAATFLYALTVLRSVTNELDDVPLFVPHVSVTLAYVLVIACVAMFLTFINFITQSIRVSVVISRVGDTTTERISHLYPPPRDTTEGGSTSPTWSPDPGAARARVYAHNGHGLVTQIDYRRLVDVAQAADAVIVLEARHGEFVPEGGLIATLWGTVECPDDVRAAVRQSVILGTDRSLLQDVAFGIRQLVDVAERALSPGINDPTTAVQAINEIHRILRELVQRDVPSPYICDSGDVVRVIYQPFTMAYLIDIGVREIMHYGADSVQIPPRVCSMLEDLHDAALPAHRGVVSSVMTEFCDNDAHGEEDSKRNAPHGQSDLRGRTQTAAG